MNLSRRQLLAGVGTALAGVGAGCSTVRPTGDENGDANDTDEPEAESEVGTEASGTTLGEISVENVHGRAHELDVVVEFGGEIEHWTTAELETGEGTTLERAWSSEPGQFRVMARLDEEDPVQVRPETWNEPDCLDLLVWVDRDGELAILSDTDGSYCENGGEPSDRTDGD